MSNAGSRFVYAVALSIGVGFIYAGPGLSAPRWVEEGPGPILNGQAAIPPNNPVAGAINAIAASQTNPDLVYVGTVNGGIWKTTNATADSPSWTPLTDRRLPGLSINSLAISPVHPRILFAGTGSTSSYNFDGSPGFGVARSSDGGRTWTVLSGDIFAGRPIDSIVPTTLDGGNVVLAATFFPFLPAGGAGVFRSTDMGTSFVRLSGDGSSGLPDLPVSSLVADPGNSSRFYAAVPATYGPTSSAGVYRSDDGGLTWIAVNAGLTGLDTSAQIHLSVHNNSSRGTNAVYAFIIGPSEVESVFRSDSFGATWTSMGAPDPILHGFFGFLFGAIAADPQDPNVVFISGDSGGCGFGNNWRGDASVLPGFPWTSVDCTGAGDLAARGL